MKRMHQKYFDMKNQKPLTFSVTWILFFLSLGLPVRIDAEIKNGYQKDVRDYEATLKNYKNILLNDDLTLHQKRTIKSQIESLVNNICYYHITEHLIIQFQKIAPDLFNEVNAILDGKGRAVNVYIKIIPENGSAVKAWGITYLNQLTNDSDAYVSEYGAHTVSIKIWATNEAMFVLAHELGHVKYQVPHLGSYIKDYKKYYTTRSTNVYHLGHHPKDKSGKSAHVYVKRFRKEYVHYFKSSREKLESPLVLHQRIRRNYRYII
jgi:hypothetical protein